MSRFAIILLTIAAFSAAAGQLLFKIGARGRQDWVAFVNPAIVSGLALYGMSTLVWIYALSFEKLVNVYAFTALTFVLVYLGGALLIGERISAGAGIGIGLVLAGLYLITNQNA